MMPAFVPPTQPITIGRLGSTWLGEDPLHPVPRRRAAPQDWFVYMNYLHHLPMGFYVDLGASSYKLNSNTWFFDVCLGASSPGWSVWDGTSPPPR